MSRLTALIGAGLVALFASVANSQDAPSIEPWPLEKISAMGLEIMLQDQAAWVGTDALLAAASEEQLEGLAGWIVSPDGDHLVVRFIADDGVNTPTARWDIPVIDGKAGSPELVSLTEQALSSEDLA